MSATFSDGDCEAWIQRYGANGVLRVATVARALRVAAASLADALEAFAIAHPDRCRRRYIASASASQGTQNFIARVSTREEALKCIAAQCANAGVAPVAGSDVTVRLDAVVLFSASAERDAAADAVVDAPPLLVHGAAKGKPATPTTTTTDAIAQRAAARGPALLRASSGVAERVYRTFSRLQLQSGDLSGGSSAELSPTLPKPSEMPPPPAKKTPQPTPVATPAAAPPAAPKRTERAFEVAAEPEVKLTRAESTPDVPAPAQEPQATTTTGDSLATAPPAATSAAAPPTKTGGNMMMAWLNKTPSAADPKPAASGSPDAPKAKRGRPPMTEQQKAEAAAKRQAAKAGNVGIGAKSTNIRMGSGAALLDDDDEEERDDHVGTAQKEDEEEAAPAVSASLDADDDDAPIALAMAAAAPKRTPAEAAAAARRAKQELEEARARDLERHQLDEYERECARVQAEMASAEAAATPMAFELSDDVKSTVVAPPAPVPEAPAAPPVVRIASSTVTPLPARKAARPAPTAPACQPTLSTFAAAGQATSDVQRLHRREVREDMEIVNGEYVSKDVVVYVNTETGAELSEAAYRQLLHDSGVRLGTTPSKSPQTTAKRLAADDGMDAGDEAPVAAPVQPTVVKLQPRDGNAAAPKPSATAAKEKPSAGKKTSSKAPPPGTRSIASFFGKK